jgi:MFS family permease
VVVVLMLIYVNSFLDRSILSLLVDPIRSTLHISESQMGFLMGPAFAIFYIIAGLPLGRLADVMPRRWLVFGGQFVWSIMSVACAFIGQYWQFLSLRVGLGVGEASLSPAAYSMITDLFPRNKLSRALSVYGFGIFLGAGFARLHRGSRDGDDPTADARDLLVADRVPLRRAAHYSALDSPVDDQRAAAPRHEE